MSRRRLLALAFVAVSSMACGEGVAITAPMPAIQPRELRINEVVSDNEGVWVDELGETDDYVELANAAEQPLALSDYAIEDRSGRHALPAYELRPGEAVLLWADESPEQGPLHLAFKISSGGERLRLLRARDDEVVDQVTVPALAEHHAFARIPDATGDFEDCGWATPTRRNGVRCGPPPPPEMPLANTFEPYVWPEPWPEPPSPVAITELLLDGEAFVEIANTSSARVDLDGFSLRVAPQAVGTALPDASQGTELSGFEGVALDPGERHTVPLPPEVAASSVAPGFEGKMLLFDPAGGVLDQVEVESWPSGAALARYPDPEGPLSFCTTQSPGAPNEECSALESRAVGDHLLALRTPGDFAALAAGRRSLGIESVEFVVDLASNDSVSFLDSAVWDLHYTFVREMIYHEPHLDRCDQSQLAEFYRGWYAFSEQEYFRVEGRRFLLGTLVRHAGTDLSTVEFAPGDVIEGWQMAKAFFTVMQQVDLPARWALRPQTPEQLAQMRTIEGELPIVDTNAPFRGLSFQPLTAAVGYGTLRFVSADAIASEALGSRDILVTDLVPNDVPPVAGLVTESFQTPLAHVNVLSRGRGTPNMALPGAESDPRFAPLYGELVRLEVTGVDFELTRADPAEALEYWESRRPVGPPLAPRLDASVRGVRDLETSSLADMPAIGAKAAQLAELARVPFASCSGPASTPVRAFAVPVVYSLEHYEASGARELLDGLRSDPGFLADPALRRQGLEQVAALVRAHPVDPELLAEVSAEVEARWPGQPLRFRSSSNTEDLATFNGAGLYESVGVDADERPAGVEDALRTVWASLFSLRAYDEREQYNVDQGAVAMAVLVHQGFRSEAANGVAISRDALQPTRGDRYYINAQIGEALVTNPAPGILSDELTHDPNRTPHETYHSHSTFARGVPVMTGAELAQLGCNLGQVHAHFRPLLDPAGEDRWFAMDVEFKLLGPERALLFKQARPYSFGSEAPSDWCDF